MKKLLFLFLLMLPLISPAREYNISSIRVIDGDTVKADINLGFDIVLRKQLIRLSNIDAPETRTKNPLEKQAGLAVKMWLCSKIDSGKVFIIRTAKKERGKFGRPLALLIVDKLDLCAIMLSQGLVIKYNGKKKLPWSERQLRYINIILQAYSRVNIPKPTTKRSTK